MRLEYNINEVKIDDILPLLYKMFDAEHLDFNIRYIDTDLEFIILSNLKNIPTLIEHIRFLNVLFKDRAIIRIRTKNLHNIKYAEIKKLSVCKIDYLEYIIENNKTNSFDIYRINVNLMNLTEFDIKCSVYSKNASLDLRNKIYVQIYSDLENLKRGIIIKEI